MDKSQQPIAPTIIDPHRPAATAEPSSDAAPLGGRYEILRELGAGGMGRVYQARDRETSEVLALKVLRPEVAAEPSMAERFKNELRLARRITHKNVCRIYDFNRIDTLAYISMEYVDGETLRALIDRSGRLPPSRVTSLTRQICAGLAEAHAQGVIHRDLKPENIMLAANGSVKLMDFGIARSIAASATTTQTLIGTPAYMAPEQVQGRPVDARADIYALGLILYECLTGRRAFAGTTPVEVALKQLQQRPPAPRQLRPEVPRALEAVVLRCLEKDPTRRFASAEAVAAALIGASDTSSITTMPRRRWPWAVALVVLLVIGGGWMKRHRAALRSISEESSAVAIIPTPGPRINREPTPALPARKPAAIVDSGPGVSNVEHESPRVAYQKLREAAEAGDADAQFRLAQMLFNGPEALRDESKALEWLTRAAEQGNADAQFALGMMYERGRGVARDLRAARSWFERAAASGHEGAQRSLSRQSERPAGRLRALRQSP